MMGSPVWRYAVCVLVLVAAGSCADGDHEGSGTTAPPIATGVPTTAAIPTSTTTTVRFPPAVPEEDVHRAVAATLPHTIDWADGPWYCSHELLDVTTTDRDVTVVAEGWCEVWRPEGSDVSNYAGTHIRLRAVFARAISGLVLESFVELEGEWIAVDPGFAPELQALAHNGLPAVLGPELGSGTSCADLAGAGYLPAHALAYWVREGRPKSLDADGDGVPCEAAYPAASLAAALHPAGLDPPLGATCGDLIGEEEPYAGALAAWVTAHEPAEMDPDGNGIPCDETYPAEAVAAVLAFDVWREPWAGMAVLHAPDAHPDDGFGRRVALAGDVLAVLGVGGGEAPALYVYVRDGGGWGEPTVFRPRGVLAADGLATDGTRVVVGLTGRDDHGGVAVYERTGGRWEETVILGPEDAGDVRFGGSAAVEGDRILVTADGPAVLLLTADTAGWQPQTLTLGMEPPLVDRWVTALSTEVVAAQRPEAGEVTLATWTGTAWLEETLRDPAGDPLSWFGAAVALDGDRLVVGASGASPGGGGASQAWVFDRTAAGWEPAASWEPGRVDFVANVAVRGEVVAIAAPLDLPGRPAMWLFAAQDGQWSETSYPRPPGSHQFGGALSLADGMLAVGAPGIPVSAGAVYLIPLP